VGGAKLCLGLQRVLASDGLQIAVNTGDDFEHLGLRISPDIDTTVYTLSGMSNAELGWGRAGETWTFMDVLRTLGGATWFRLGDGDLALHVERTRRLQNGERLSEITADVAARWGLRTRIFPMSDDAVRTVVSTSDGEMEFQDYFVRHRCEPVISALRFEGAEQAHISPNLYAALLSPELSGIVIAPSNPYLSIDPILSLPQMRELVGARAVPCIAVTPIIGDAAVKGPTAKIMRELGIQPSPLGVVEHYGGLIDGFVLDSRDQLLAGKMDLHVEACDTLMSSLEDRERVANSALKLLGNIKSARRGNNPGR